MFPLSLSAHFFCQLGTWVLDVFIFPLTITHLGNKTINSVTPVLSNGEGNGNPQQYFCLENSMDRGAWWAIVHRVAKSRMQLSDYHFFPYLDFFFFFTLDGKFTFQNNYVQFRNVEVSRLHLLFPPPHPFLVCSVMSSSLWPHGLYVACQAPLSMEFSRQKYGSG